MQAKIPPDIGYRIKERNHQAFRILYVNTFGPMRKYAFRYVYDWDEAADIVQQAFLSLWLNLDKYSPDTNIVLYLTSIVHNLCSNYLRHLDVVDSNHEKVIEATVFSQLQEYCEIHPDVRRKLDNALRELPSQSHHILHEHIVSGKKVSEIASEMNISESTVKTHLKRALRFLRKHMLMIVLFAQICEL